jgi:transketolase
MGVTKVDQHSRVQAYQRLLQMHFESGVGHIGGNLSVLDALLVIFSEYLSKSDQLVLSKGHAAGAFYIGLWSIGRLVDADLKTFHKDNTSLPGHLPSKGIPEVSFATGSLGHGLSLAAGTALGFKLRNTEAKTYCMMSDGEWQEGSTWEALIFACHHRLSHLTVLVDHNELQGFGNTANTASMAPLWDRLAGFNLDLHVIDGHDMDAIREALNTSGDRVKVIILKTIKGHGVRFMEHKMEWHYLPLSPEQFAIALQDIEKMT